ncbi:MAG: hypothetical protein R3E95_10335 [Thiolinea sp.]
MNDTATARGAITFLFALGTITLAVVLVGASLFSIGEDSEKRKQRFSEAKEILTMLIGIFGTIIGFYFGAINSTESNQALSVAAPQIINPTPAPGEKFSMVAQITGGKPPYNYEFSFDEGMGIKPLENLRTDSGLIVQEFEMPEGLESGESYNISLRVTDAVNRGAGVGYMVSVR